MDKREKKSFFFKNLFLQFMSYPQVREIRTQGGQAEQTMAA